MGDSAIKEVEHGIGRVAKLRNALLAYLERLFCSDVEQDGWGSLGVECRSGCAEGLVESVFIEGCASYV
jgi:hypothetical protein